jgi:hypothetical protein
MLLIDLNGLSSQASLPISRKPAQTTPLCACLTMPKKPQPNKHKGTNLNQSNKRLTKQPNRATINLHDISFISSLTVQYIKARYKLNAI